MVRLHPSLPTPVPHILPPTPSTEPQGMVDSVDFEDLRSEFILAFPDPELWPRPWMSVIRDQTLTNESCRRRGPQQGCKVPIKATSRAARLYLNLAGPLTKDRLRHHYLFVHCHVPRYLLQVFCKVHEEVMVAR